MRAYTSIFSTHQRDLLRTYIINILYRITFKCREFKNKTRNEIISSLTINAVMGPSNSGIDVVLINLIK